MEASAVDLESAMKHSPIGMALVAPSGAWLEVNPALCELVGYTRDELLAGDFQSITHPEDLALNLYHVEQALTGMIERYELEKRYIRKDGRIVWVELHVSLIWNADGTPKHFISQIVDITERRRAAQSQVESRAKLLLALHGGRIATWEYDVVNDRFTYDDHIPRIFQSRRDARTFTLADYLHEFVVPEDKATVANTVRDALGSLGDAFTAQFEHQVIRHDGSRGVHLVWFSAIKNGARVVKLVGATQDVTERRHAEQRLRDSEERLRQVTENLREIVWVKAADTQEILYISPAYEQIYGRTCASLYAAPRSWLEAIHPDDRERARTVVPSNASDGEYRVIRADGQVRHLHARTFPVKDANGRVYRVVGVAEDVTERRRVEEQFRQAQKMEAVGQLAGGVAHDFNNILSAILMQVEEARSHPAVDAELHEAIAGIGAAADRAVKLTRQLLLFSRKQLMQPRQVDLNEVVSGFTQLLRRVLPESVDIRLRPGPRPAIALADPSMLEQVLMNLAVNARDAMPTGGLFSIEIGHREITEDDARSIPEATAGRYVTLRVTDDGCGIPPDVLPRIFEPFFTTKEAGQGTGLGLATVFGIVKQHRGWISVTSAPDRGTSFEVVLPASPELAKPRTRTLPPGMPRGGNETILLVEDDPSLRRLTRALLVRHGYNVLEARSGVEALEVWDAATERIDLVLTDLVMPDGVSGRDLAHRLQARSPTLKIILTSGYGADISPRSREARLGPSFLAKPCSPRTLLEAVRTCLDG